MNHNSNPPSTPPTMQYKAIVNDLVNHTITHDVVTITTPAETNRHAADMVNTIIEALTATAAAMADAATTPGTTHELQAMLTAYAIMLDHMSDDLTAQVD